MQRDGELVQSSARRWKRGDLSDREVLRAYWVARTANDIASDHRRRGEELLSICTPSGVRIDLPPGRVFWAYDVLMAENPGLPFKVAYAAMQRADDHDLLDYGVSLRGGFPTDAGRQMLEEMGLRWVR